MRHYMTNAGAEDAIKELCEEVIMLRCVCVAVAVMGRTSACGWFAAERKHSAL